MWVLSRVMGELEADRRACFTGEGMDLNARLLVGMATATDTYRRWFPPTGRHHISRERELSEDVHLGRRSPSHRHTIQPVTEESEVSLTPIIAW